jgi:hypothetical protein
MKPAIPSLLRWKVETLLDVRQSDVRAGCCYVDFALPPALSINRSRTQKKTAAVGRRREQSLLLSIANPQ